MCGCKDKQVEPSAQVVQPAQIPVRHEGNAIVRALVGEGRLARPPQLVLLGRAEQFTISDAALHWISGS